MTLLVGIQVWLNWDRGICRQWVWWRIPRLLHAASDMASICKVLTARVAQLDHDVGARMSLP